MRKGYPSSRPSHCKCGAELISTKAFTNLRSQLFWVVRCPECDAGHCPKCGRHVSDGRANYCTECGQSLELTVVR